MKSTLRKYAEAEVLFVFTPKFFGELGAQNSDSAHSLKPL